MKCFSKIYLSVRIGILCCVSAACASAFAAEEVKVKMQDILSGSIRSELVAGTESLMRTGDLSDEEMSYTESVSHVFYKKEPVISLIPENNLLKSFELQLPSGDSPDLVIESLYILNKRNSSVDKDDMEKIEKIVRSFSTLEGVSYVSSDEKVETLYHKAYTIENLETRNKIPDQISGSADGKRLYMYQYDNSFKDCIYSVDYRVSGNTLLLTMVIADYIKMGPIKAVKPGNVSITILIELAEDGVAMNSIVMSKFANVPFIAGKIQHSFQARTDAMFQWFVKSYLNKGIQ